MVVRVFVGGRCLIGWAAGQAISWGSISGMLVRVEAAFVFGVAGAPMSRVWYPTNAAI